MRHKIQTAIIAVALCSCTYAYGQTSTSNVGPRNLIASEDRADPSKYEGATEAIAIGIGKHEAPFYRTVINNNSVTYVSAVNRNIRNGTSLAWDVTVLKHPANSDVKLYVGLSHYDCRARTSVWLHTMSITETGNILDRSTPYFQDVPNAEGTGGDEMMKFACGEPNNALPVKDLLNDANRFFSIVE